MYEDVNSIASPVSYSSMKTSLKVTNPKNETIIGVKYVFCMFERAMMIKNMNINRKTVEITFLKY